MSGVLDCPGSREPSLGTCALHAQSSRLLPVTSAPGLGGCGESGCVMDHSAFSPSAIAPLVSLYVEALAGLSCSRWPRWLSAEGQCTQLPKWPCHLPLCWASVHPFCTLPSAAGLGLLTVASYCDSCCLLLTVCEVVLFMWTGCWDLFSCEGLKTFAHFLQDCLCCFRYENSIGNIRLDLTTGQHLFLVGLQKWQLHMACPALCLEVAVTRVSRSLWSLLPSDSTAVHLDLLGFSLISVL